MKTVLFACVHNAGRSQMAAAMFNVVADPDKARGVSAGTQPGAHIHPEVVEVMREIGIDLKHGRPQHLTAELAQQANLLVTMGCGEVCPYVPGLRRVDWKLQDPKGLPLSVVRTIRDQVKTRVQALASQEGWLPAMAASDF